MNDVARVYIGCAPNHEDAESQAVLEYSLRKHASIPVCITWMKHRRHDPIFDGWQSSNWPTPFSGFRWIVPELAGFEGRAVYMDSDVIVLGDIAELINMELEPGKMIAAKSANRLCVSLWDCAAIKKLMPSIEELKRNTQNHYDMQRRIKNAANIVQPFIGGEWNNLDGESSELPVKALHYTSMPHQPHAPYARFRLEKAGRKHWFDGTVKPHWNKEVVELFNRYLFEAEQNGFEVDYYCQDPIYGDYKKRSLQGMTGAVPSWGR